MAPFMVMAAMYALASMVAFCMYGFDKQRATVGKRRVSEMTLHITDLCCGWPGGLLAQQLFRHKTRKAEFLTVYWIMVALNVAVAGVVARVMLG